VAKLIFTHINSELIFHTKFILSDIYLNISLI